MGFAIPLVAAAGSLYQSISAARQARNNAEIMGQQRANAINQANSQEGIVRRQSREALGRQAAAFGAAGVGYGGSSATSLEQSAVNQELDALNTRYRGAITGWGYGVEQQNYTSEAKQDLISAPLLAGAALLKNMPSYSTGTPSAATQSGLSAPGGFSGLGAPLG